MKEDPGIGSGVGTKALLQGVLVASTGLGDFLDGLVDAAVSDVSADGTTVSVSVTLLRPRTKVTIASSCAAARHLAKVQVRYHDGPSVRAAETGATVSTPDVASEVSLPLYSAAALEYGIRSSLDVPVALEGPERASINYYSSGPAMFSADRIDLAEHFARQASAPLGLALRVARLAERAEDLTAAMESRTTIDLAAGVIMAQNRCSQEGAIDILRAASSARGIKLRDLASTILTSTIDAPVTTHFD
jgi:GAF domain-containing protein